MLVIVGLVACLLISKDVVVVVLRDRDEGLYTQWFWGFTRCWMVCDLGHVIVFVCLGTGRCGIGLLMSRW